MEFIKNKIKMILSTHHEKDTSDIIALNNISGLMHNYIAWTSSSIRPSAISILLNDILINKRKNVIEFGSGISTLYIAQMIKREGGHFVSVEHDKNWISIVEDMLKKESLDGVVKFIHAPLEKSKYSLNNLSWYSEKALNYYLETFDFRFDLILIDGPMAYTQELELSRYPVIPFLKSKDLISESSSIYLDDIHRAGEQKIVKKWKNEFKYVFSNHYKVGGVAISFNGDSYTVI